MPELPEVETIRRQLQRNIVNKKINDVVVRWGKRLEPSRSKFIENVKGRTVKSIERRGKLLRINLSSGWSIFVHLKMTGKLILKRTGTEPTKHTHVVFKLNGKYDVHWEDFRKFGFLKLLSKEDADKYVESWNFGPEPLDPSFTFSKFKMCLNAYPNAKIKPKLLEQKCIAGIGNIYAVESLWSAKIHPLTQIKDIPEDKLKKLFQAIKRILKTAIADGGTSADNYFDAHGGEGKYVYKLKAYKQEGKPCANCKTKIIKEKIGGRGTAYCPKCQKL